MGVSVDLIKSPGVTNDDLAPTASSTVTFRLHDEMLARLDAKARQMGLRRSTLIILGINHVLSS